MIILSIFSQRSRNIWMTRTVDFWKTCSRGHRTCRRTAGNPEKRSERKIGANLSLSYRFAPDLYRYEISTVYEVTVITEKEVKQQEAALNKKYEDYGMVRNSGVYSGHSATIIYPSAATKGEYLDDCGIRSVPESGKYYCYFDIVRQNKYKNDSSIKVTYTTDGSIPTLNSYDAGNEVHFKMTSQTPTVKVHIYKDGKLVALYYYTNGHLYANNGEYDE